MGSAVSAITTPIQPCNVLSQCTPPLNNWAANFSVDCSRLSIELLNELNSKQKTTPKLLRELVKTVVGQIMKLTKRPERQNLRTIAAKIACKWPGCFDDKLGDIVLGSGSESLFLQLENGVDNHNRATISSTARKRLAVQDVEEADTSLNSSDSNKLKKTRPSIDQYGCIDIDPKGMPVGETLDTLEQKRLLMIDVHNRIRHVDKEQRKYAESDVPRSTKGNK